MVYERIAALLPSRLVNWVRDELVYVGSDISAKRFLGFVFTFGLGISLAVAINAQVFFSLPFAASFVVAFALFAGGSMFWINNLAESEGRFVEKILPDALQLIASNIKSGLTTERALFISARPEFGPLSEELKETSKRILSGQRIELALQEISKNIKSRILDRTIWLIGQGIKSGGQIADLLIQLSSDLREENSLKAEASANISMYVMMIFFSAAFGAPMLFGISSYIVGVLGEQTANIGISAEDFSEYSTKSPALSIIGIPQSSITEEFVAFFAQVALLFTCIFASMVLGVISGGSEKRGVKFLPMLLIVAFLLFYVTRFVMAQFFGSVTIMI